MKVGKDEVRVNIDEVLRIGSVLERTNLDQQKREAFDWLAENRERMNDDRKRFAQYLNIAIGDLVMSKKLVQKALNKLVKKNIVTKEEYDKYFRRFENVAEDKLPTVTQISYILQENCMYFQTETE